MHLANKFCPKCCKRQILLLYDLLVLYLYYFFSHISIIYASVSICLALTSGWLPQSCLVHRFHFLALASISTVLPQILLLTRKMSQHHWLPSQPQSVAAIDWYWLVTGAKGMNKLPSHHTATFQPGVELQTIDPKDNTQHVVPLCHPKTQVALFILS